ncbi:cyclophilin-like family protein [Candidatus Hodarchaeum mangrovi]
MSNQEFILEFSILGNSDIGKVVFKKHLAPKTYALLEFRLRNPIQSRVVVRDDEVSIPFKIGRAGPENTVKYVNQGDVAYWTQSQVLIIFIKSKEVEYPVNPIGQVENLTFFNQLKIGSSIKLEMVKDPIDEIKYL